MQHWFRDRRAAGLTEWLILRRPPTHRRTRMKHPPAACKGHLPSLGAVRLGRLGCTLPGTCPSKRNRPNGSNSTTQIHGKIGPCLPLQNGPRARRRPAVLLGCGGFRWDRFRVYGFLRLLLLLLLLLVPVHGMYHLYYMYYELLGPPEGVRITKRFRRTPPFLKGS